MIIISILLFILHGVHHRVLHELEPVLVSIQIYIEGTSSVHIFHTNYRFFSKPLMEILLAC